MNTAFGHRDATGPVSNLEREPTAASGNGKHDGRACRATSLWFDLPEGCRSYKGQLARLRAESCARSGTALLTGMTTDGRHLQASLDHVLVRSTLFKLREALASCARLERSELQPPPPPAFAHTIQVNFWPQTKASPLNVAAEICFLLRQVWLTMNCGTWRVDLYLHPNLAAALAFDLERANTDLEKWSDV